MLEMEAFLSVQKNHKTARGHASFCCCHDCLSSPTLKQLETIGAIADRNQHAKSHGLKRPSFSPSDFGELSC